MGAAARTIDPEFRTAPGNGYDGQFYWGVAVDPLATGSVHHAFDKASYRYGHPLFGWVGWLFSAGQPQAVPAVLAIAGIISLFVAAATAASLGIGRGRFGWEGLFVALNPGLVYAAAHELAEPLATALLLGAFSAVVRRRTVTTWVLLALLPLAKEQLVLVLLAVCVWELRERRPKRAAIFATASIPALAWWTYARIVFGAWFTTGTTALGFPFFGWERSFSGTLGHEKARYMGTRLDGVGLAALTALLLLIVLGTLIAVRRNGPLELAYLGLGAIAFCLAANATFAFTTALRNTAFLVALLPFVIVTPPLSDMRRRSRNPESTREL
jgi:hypothetical protein